MPWWDIGIHVPELNLANTTHTYRAVQDYSTTALPVQTTPGIPAGTEP